MLQIGNWTFPEKDQDCFWGGVLRLQKQVKQVFAGEMGNWKFGIEGEFLLVWTEEQEKTETMRAALREAAEKVLDFLTVRQVEYNALKEPEWNWMFFYRESGKTTVEMYDRTVLEMTVTCEVSVIPKTGMAKAEMERWNRRFGGEKDQRRPALRRKTVEAVGAVLPVCCHEQQPVRCLSVDVPGAGAASAVDDAGEEECQRKSGRKRRRMAAQGTWAGGRRGWNL